MKDIKYPREIYLEAQIASLKKEIDWLRSLVGKEATTAISNDIVGLPGISAPDHLVLPKAASWRTRYNPMRPDALQVVGTVIDRNSDYLEHAMYLQLDSDQYADYALHCLADMYPKFAHELAKAFYKTRTENE